MNTVNYFTKLQAGAVSFPEGVDIINIDGDHSVAGAVKDIELAKFAKVPYILVDDFAMYGVPAAWDQTKDGLSIVSTYSYWYHVNPVKMALVKNETV